MTPDALRAWLAERVPAAVAAERTQVRGQVVVMLDRAALPETLRLLRDDPATAAEQLTDLTAVDYLGREPRFEVVYQLASLSRRHRLRVKVPVPADDPVVPTASAIWKSALWAEREVWDLFGIRFAGHPDLRRILLYPEFEGHPLRKDYALDRRHPLVPERDPIARPWFPRGGAGA